MPRAKVLKALRATHLYFGVFITPAILFFAFTGAVQTLGLHETNRDHPNYVPARWLVVLGQIHKKQTPIVSPKRPQPAPEVAAKPAAEKAPTPPQPARHNPAPLRFFFLIVALGLFTSTATGLYMSYTYTRNKLLITLTLIAGTVLPPLLMLF